MISNWCLLYLKYHVDFGMCLRPRAGSLADKASGRWRSWVAVALRLQGQNTQNDLEHQPIFLLLPTT